MGIVIENAIHGFFTNSRKNRSLIICIWVSRKFFAINLVNKSRKIRNNDEKIIIKERSEKKWVDFFSLDSLLFSFTFKENLLFVFFLSIR